MGRVGMGGIMSGRGKGKGKGEGRLLARFDMFVSIVVEVINTTAYYA